jgi:hypothetical protein
MPHFLQPLSGNTLEDSYRGKAYTNDKGEAQCVEFIKQTLGAPATACWYEGTKITKGDTTILQGTAIATFVDGKFSHLGASNQHAAIYLSQDQVGIWVLDQWTKQGSVDKRNIKWMPTRPGKSNDGKAFSVIEW